MEFSSLSAMVADTFGPEFYDTVGDGSIPNGVVSRFPILEHVAWPSNFTTNRDWDWAVIDIPGKRNYLSSEFILIQAIMTKSYNTSKSAFKVKLLKATSTFF